SLLGQIMYIGFHRQRGPQGGDLTPIGDTGLLAERLDEDRVQVWLPNDRRDLSSWEKVQARATRVGPPPAVKFRIEIEQRDHEVVFPSPLQQRMELGTTSAWIIRPRLLQIPGVAEVFQVGGERKQYQVVVDPEALEEFGVPLEQVEQSVKESNVSAPGGFALQGESERPIRILGLLGPTSAAVISQRARVSIKTGRDRTVRLADVARVIEGPQPKRGDTTIDGHEGMIITVAKQPHFDTRRLTLQVEAALREIEATLP